MEIIVYLIPFIVAIGLLVFARKQTAWWEYVVLILPSMLLAFIVEECMKEYNTSDTEYLGYYVTKVSHYDAWNEYIHRTCTREVPAGRDAQGHTRYREERYDCSYVDDHPEEWTYTLNNGHEEYFYNEKEFQEAVNKLQTKPQFRDMHRDYYTLDGDCHDYYYDGQESHAITKTVSENYTNKVKSSHSLFKYETISKKEKDTLGLYDYPPIINGDQCPIVGAKMDKKSENALRYLNGYYGMSKQFRCYIFIYRDKPVNIVEKQRSYLMGANKNELIICIGYNSKHHTVDWCEAFSWSDAPILEAKAKDYFISKNRLDIVGFCKYIRPYIQKDWHRKQFNDFKYITVDLSDNQMTWVFILVLLYNIGISIWIICNSYTAAKPKGEENYY